MLLQGGDGGDMLGWLKKRRVDAGEIALPPALPLDLLSGGFVADPYPSYAWLRQNSPVCELEGGGYLLTGHGDILAAFTNADLGNAPSRFSTLAARNAEKYVAADLASHIPPFLDAPEHRAMRQMVSRSFFNSFKDFGGTLDVLAREKVAHLRVGDDLVETSAAPFAVSAMMAFCGINASAAEMKPLTQAFFHLFAPLKDPRVFEDVNLALSAFRALIATSLNAGAPKGSLLAHMQGFQMENGGISDAQIVDNCLLVFADGVENIEAGAASLMLVFEQAGIWKDLENGVIELDYAVREGLRLQTPAQLVPRVARKDCAIGGVSIKKDMPVFLALASANRDPEVYERPDNFEINRDLSGVATFGQGRHRCIGEPLAIAQLTALMREILKARFRPKVVDVSYQPRVGHRWPEGLIVKKD